MIAPRTAGSVRLRRLLERGPLGPVALVALATALGLLLRGRVAPIDIAMLYLLTVVAAAARFPRAPVLVAGALSVALFDFLFVPPYYKFTVFDQSYFVSFGVMFVVAVAMGRMTARIGEQAIVARDREREVAAFQGLMRELAGAPSAQAEAIAVRHLGRAGAGDAELVLATAPDWPVAPPFDSTEIRVAATWAVEHGEAAGWSAVKHPEGEVLVIPLKTPTRTLGVAVIRPHRPDQTLGEGALRTVKGLAEQAAIAIERRGGS